MEIKIEMYESPELQAIWLGYVILENHIVWLPADGSAPIIWEKE